MATASGRPFEVAYEPVHQAIHDMASAPGFRETLRALEQCNFRDGAAIRVPVTIAFGTRDRVLLPLIARRRTELPDHARWHKLSGCGHIAMFDDPSAVAALLVEASRTDAAGRQAVAG
jgi:pimeloyl-ACP methyl ester carboxylesterase